jgi:hypothetical protein
MINDDGDEELSVQLPPVTFNVPSLRLNSESSILNVHITQIGLQKQSSNSRDKLNNSLSPSKRNQQAFATRMSTSKRMNFLHTMTKKKNAPANPEHHQIYLEFKRKQREQNLQRIKEKQALKKHERDFGVMVIHTGNYHDFYEYYGNVRYIYLPGQQIRSIESIQFLFLAPKLRKLDLSSNNIIYLPKPEIWESLPNLQILYLHKNKITNFTTIERFVTLKSLLYLTLYSNPVAQELDYRKRVIELLPHIKALDRHVATIMDLMTGTKDFTSFVHYHPCGPNMKLPFKPLAISKEYVDCWSDYERSYDPSVPIENEVTQIMLLNAKCNPVSKIKSVWKGYSLRKQMRGIGFLVLAKMKSALAVPMHHTPMRNTPIMAAKHLHHSEIDPHLDSVKTTRLEYDAVERKSVKWSFTPRLRNPDDGPVKEMVPFYNHGELTRSKQNLTELLRKFRDDKMISKVVMMQRNVRRRLASRLTVHSYLEETQTVSIKAIFRTNNTNFSTLDKSIFTSDRYSETV